MSDAYWLKGETINTAHYVQTLQKKLYVLCANHLMKGTVIQHDNAQPHTACLTSETTAKNGLEVFPQLPYNPDLGPLDNLFSL